MTRRLLALAIVATLTVAIVLAGSATVAAQTQNETTTNSTTTTTTTPTTSTTSSTSTPTTTDSGSGDQTQTERPPNGSTVRVGPSLEIVEWSYNGDEFVVTFFADLPTRVVMSDVLGEVKDRGVSQQDAGVDTIVDQGVTTLRIDVEEYRGSAAISVSSPRSGVYLSTGISPPNPFTAVGPTTAWFGGASVVVGMGILAVRRVRGSGPDEPEAIGE